MQSIAIPLLYFYGAFLITCGIVSMAFIGLKAKTALMSGGMSGFISIAIAYLNSRGVAAASLASLIIPGLLFVVFSWRSTKTLFKVFELIPSQHDDLKGKGIAFLIISLMAVVSFMVLMIQVIHL